MEAPKLFISYSWSNAEHEQWVVNLATSLRESGIDVVLDKWDLKEGNDAVAFMEQMVTNPEILKVVLICDEKYATKADGRAGGVGTETQIISPEVYENQDQEKFVAVVCEKDESGKPFLPTYYKSRIYIDLSEDDVYAENYEKLLRWIFDKPLYVKPEIGKKPSFLSEEEHISLGTTYLFKRCIDAIKNNKEYAFGALDDYLTTFVTHLERFRLSDSKDSIDDSVITNIDEFTPYRNEAIRIFTTIAQYSSNKEFIGKLHRFFENLIPYMERPPSISQWREGDFDNFKFIVHELFLYGLAILLKHEQFDQANILLQEQYYIPEVFAHGQNAMSSFIIFWQPMRSLKQRNKRLKRLSTRADLLKERCVGTGLEFQLLMQADFVAFMRAELDSKDISSGWRPETLLYLMHSNRPFEIFARSVSKRYFENVKVLLSIETPGDLDKLLSGYKDSSKRLPSWEMESFSPEHLLGYEHLATQP